MGLLRRHDDQPTPDAPLLAVDDVRVAIRGTPILHGASLALHAGELVAVIGPNGAGKSTLVRAACGLQPTTHGDVRWQGVAIDRLRGRRLARMRAFVPQRPRVPDGITVRQAVGVGRSPHIGPLQRPTTADRDVVERAMRRAGADPFAERMLATLSGGELQRVQVAVGLAQDAPALILDEPTSSLDLGATAEIARLLRRLRDDGLGVLVVLHDLTLAAAIADRVVIVDHGRTVAAGPPDEVLDRERLASIWKVDADLAPAEDGRVALRVGWLNHPEPRVPA